MHDIRTLKTLEEMAAVEAVQQVVWSTPSTIIYRHMLLSFARNGGLILGAYQDNQLIGFLISYLGLETPDSDRPAMANLKLVSQRMAILPEFRNSGVGYDLKRAQRRFALAQGIRLITWTFDPIQSRNAHLNIHKLGAIVHEYHRDYYGTDDSALVRFNMSDRMIVEWWVTSNRVEQRLHGNRGDLTIPQFLDANATLLNVAHVGADGLLYPSETILEPQASVVLVEIPPDADKLAAQSVDLARMWRLHVREALESTLAQGFVVTDFVHGVHEGRPRSFYALSYAEYNNDVMYSSFSTN